MFCANNCFYVSIIPSEFNNWIIIARKKLIARSRTISGMSVTLLIIGFYHFEKCKCRKSLWRLSFLIWFSLLERSNKVDILFWYFFIKKCSFVCSSRSCIAFVTSSVYGNFLKIVQNIKITKKKKIPTYKTKQHHRN